MKAILAVMMLMGCSTRTVVTDISGPDVTDIRGIPFRVSVDQKLTIYRLKDDTDDYEEVSVSQHRLADQSRLYAINFSGGVFASRSLKVSQNPDNTLKTMALTTTDQTSAIIEALSGAASGLTGADTSKRTAALNSAKAIVEADKAVRDAQKDLDALPAATSAETRAIYERILESAKQQGAAARTAAGS